MSALTHDQARARARQRALAELARRHPAEFDELHAAARLELGLPAQPAAGMKVSGRPPCGTRNGAAAHRRRGEPLCSPCATAERLYARAWRSRRRKARQ